MEEEKKKRGRPKGPPQTHKTCGECRQHKPTTEFHKCGQRFQARCKPCHIKQTTARAMALYVKKPTGPDKLPQEQKNRLFEMCANGNRMMEISRELSIPYARLQAWKKKGRI